MHSEVLLHTAAKTDGVAVAGSPTKSAHAFCSSRRTWLIRPSLSLNLRAASLVRWPRARNWAIWRLRRGKRRSQAAKSSFVATSRSISRLRTSACAGSGWVKSRRCRWNASTACSTSSSSAWSKSADWSQTRSTPNGEARTNTIRARYHHDTPYKTCTCREDQCTCRRGCRAALPGYERSQPLMRHRRQAARKGQGAWTTWRLSRSGRWLLAARCITS